MNKYLDFDSSYRNRTLWPNSGEFEVQIAPSGLKDAINAQDPVSDAYPLLAWTSNRFQSNIAVSTIVTGIVSCTGIGSTNSKNLVIFTTQPNHLQRKKNYYRHAVLRFPIGDENARITSYEYLGNNKAMVMLDGNVNIMAGDSLFIGDPTDFIDPHHAFLFVPAGSNSPNDYQNYQIINEHLRQSRPIINYNETTSLLQIGGESIPMWLPSHNYSIRKITPILSTIAGIGSTTNVIYLTEGENLIGKLIGSFIRILPTKYDNFPSPPEMEIRRIVTADGIMVTVFPPFSSTTLEMSIELLQFTRDNSVPFVYSGTRENGLLTFKIKLESLSIPNTILSGGRGGQIAFYPYVYVELAPSGVSSNNITYSNNPNATKALFRIPIQDTQNLKNATFVNLTGNGIVHELQTNLETSFKVRIFLPNGDTFKTIEQEFYSPSPSNPNIQISTLFKMQLNK